MATLGQDGLRVLIIDDDDLIRGAIARLLTSLGHETTQANSLAAARASVQAGPYDVVISDLAMPGCTDLDILDVIRGSLADAPIIVISGTAAADAAVEASTFGVFQFLPKPFAPPVLLDAVARAGRRHASRTQSPR